MAAAAISTAGIVNVASSVLAILQPMAAKAMEILIDKAADKTADKTVDTIVDKGKAIYQSMVYKTKDEPMVNVVDKIKREISSLQTTLGMIERAVQVAEEKQVNDVFIQNWLRDLVDIGYKARDVLDDFMVFSYCIVTAEDAPNLVNFTSSLMLSYFPIPSSSSDASKLPLVDILKRLEKDIRSVRERFDEKTKEAEKLAIINSAVGGGSESLRINITPRPEVGAFMNKQRDDLFLGREEVKNSIMEKILHPSDNNRVHVVALWGMGGIGKTTLALSIYNDERVKNKSWLCVGENKFSAEKVIREILDDKNTTGIGNLQKKLVEKLEGNRFLIVLDDVWDVDGSQWNLLFNPLTRVEKGRGTIIITTRKREVCTATNTQHVYELELLSEQDSWSIFESCAFYTNGESDSTLSTLKSIGKEIVKKLNGLPLALKVVGGSLLNKDSIVWTDFLKSNDWTLTNDEDPVMSALRWSYNQLPRHLKACFSYCSLFPKDHFFIEEELVQMWMAHDLIQKEKGKQPEDVGARYFNQLVNASLLQCILEVYSPGTKMSFTNSMPPDRRYVMHDIIHDLALFVSNEEFATTDASLPIDQMDKVRHVTITHGDYSKIPNLCQIKKLLTLYPIERNITYGSWCHDSVLSDVFQQPKSMRVLVLCINVRVIPDCISELKHLRYLDVSETSVESLPDSLCRLYFLQVLAAPSHVALPRDVVNMVNLRHVRGKLSTCKGVGKLTSLQELSSIRICEGDDISELGDLQELRGKLIIEGLEKIKELEDGTDNLLQKQTRLEELELHSKKGYWSTISEEESNKSQKVLDILGCPPNLRCLKIVGYIGVDPPSWMAETNIHKFEKLQMLELSLFPKLESLPRLGELTSLSHLTLSYMDSVKKLGKEFYGNSTRSKALFPCLELLSFSRMKEWERWDDITTNNSSMSFFPRLAKLEIKDCAKLVSVLPAVVMNRTSKRKLGEQLPSLKSLWLEDCPQLQSLPPDFHKIPSLEKLYIISCPQLQSLLLDFHELSSLHTLHIDRLPRIQWLPPGFHRLPSLHTLYIDRLPRLQSLLPGFHMLSSLSELSIISCPELQSLPQDFHMLSSLEHLEISNCEKLEPLPPDFHKLSSLKNLRIEYYPQLQSLPPHFHRLSSLKHLKIKDCQKLQSLPRDFHELSSLEKLYINGCSKLESLPPDFHRLSSLKHLEIKSCEVLQSLPRDFHKLSSLKNLRIEYCPQLQSLPPYFHELSSLIGFEIKSCPELQSLPPYFHKLSCLNSLRIKSCPQLQSLPPDLRKLSSLRSLFIKDCPRLRLLIPYFKNFSSLEELQIVSFSEKENQSLKRSINSLVIAYQKPLEERCRLSSSHDWHQIKHIPNLLLKVGECDFIRVCGSTIDSSYDGRDDNHSDDDYYSDDEWWLL